MGHGSYLEQSDVGGVTRMDVEALQIWFKHGLHRERKDPEKREMVIISPTQQFQTGKVWVQRSRKTHGAIGGNGGDVAQHDGLRLHVSLQQPNQWLHDDPKLVARGDVVVELGHAHHHLQSRDSHMINIGHMTTNN